MSDLLPPTSTALEHKLVAAQQHLSALPLATRHIRNPSTCPEPILPFLAWELSVDDWNPDWSESVKRRVINDSISIHRRKGTRGAVRRALESLFGDVGFTLVEGASGGVHDGTHLHNGATFYGQSEHWAKYKVYVNRPISQQTAADVRRILASVAPARCHLIELNFEQALNAYNGAIRYDNTFTHGVS